ncbi:MAG TPA: hypothetical protein VHV77_02985 [Pirellulales bacterium]|jgi:hypothetical protein|nr:hypothetical protein [Pirellulales bacterium]
MLKNDIEALVVGCFVLANPETAGVCFSEVEEQFWLRCDQVARVERFTSHA